MDTFACSLLSKVIEMPNFGSIDDFEGQNDLPDFVNENLDCDHDLLMEQILESISTTGVGGVLKRIASLPEVRRQKVLDVRRQLTEGEYDLNDRLDGVLEKVLEVLKKQENDCSC